MYLDNSWNIEPWDLIKEDSGESSQRKSAGGSGETSEETKQFQIGIFTHLGLASLLVQELSQTWMVASQVLVVQSVVVMVTTQEVPGYLSFVSLDQYFLQRKESFQSNHLLINIMLRHCFSNELDDRQELLGGNGVMECQLVINAELVDSQSIIIRCIDHPEDTGEGLSSLTSQSFLLIVIQHQHWTHHSLLCTFQ